VKRFWRFLSRNDRPAREQFGLVFVGSAVVGAIAVAVTGLLGDEGWPRTSEALGLFGTWMALGLAVGIYRLTQADARAANDDLLEQLRPILPSAEQPVGQPLFQTAGIDDMPLDYLHEFLTRSQVPLSHVARVARRSQGRGAHPWVVEVTDGSSWTVWRGGRNGGFHVKRIQPPPGDE
jgi:hypothetical protein